jgi:hypothetical protein
MKVVDVNKARGGELSLFESSLHHGEGGEGEAGESKIFDDLKEIRKFLEELYNQLEEN